MKFNKEFGKHSVGAMICSSITSNKNTYNAIVVVFLVNKYFVDKDGNMTQQNVPDGFDNPYFSTIDAGKGGTYSGNGTIWKYRNARRPWGTCNFIAWW